MGIFIFKNKNMLNQERINEIKRIIKDNNLYDKSLNQIARENNIEVIFADLSIISSEKPLSWAIWFINSKYKIYIDSTIHWNRQRFTFAHELWHFFLHKNILEEKWIIIDWKEKYLFRNNIYDNISSENKWMEEEANEFAWNLLMPEEKIIEAYNLYGYNIWLFSEIFKVSPSAIEYRLFKLNIKDDWE